MRTTDQTAAGQAAKAAPATSRTRQPRRWASLKEACGYSGFAERTIRARISDGQLPAYRPTGSRVLRVDLNDVDALIEGAGRIPTAHLADSD